MLAHRIPSLDLSGGGEGGGQLSMVCVCVHAALLEVLRSGLVDWLFFSHDLSTVAAAAAVGVVSVQVFLLPLPFHPSMKGIRLVLCSLTAAFCGSVFTPFHLLLHGTTYSTSVCRL